MIFIHELAHISTLNFHSIVFLPALGVNSEARKGYISVQASVSIFGITKDVRQII